jgi:hypothetical protein
MTQVSKIVSFFLFPALVFLSHLIAARILHLYDLSPHIDIPFHFVGGLSIAYASTKNLSYLETENITAGLNRVIFLILILCLTATMTVFWEFAEFLSDQLLGTRLQTSLANTMQDQFLGILGGCTWVFLYYARVRKRTA